MARKSTFVKEPRVNQYDLKQSLIRTGYGYLPEELRTKALAQIKDQNANWISGFGVLHRNWMAVVDRVLAPSTVPKLDYAKYKAFVNEYSVKVLAKHTETPDMVKTKFTNLGADSSILDTITGVIGEVMG
jgi:hypothetical protein